MAEHCESFNIPETDGSYEAVGVQNVNSPTVPKNYESSRKVLKVSPFREERNANSFDDETSLKHWTRGGGEVECELSVRNERSNTVPPLDSSVVEDCASDDSEYDFRSDAPDCENVHQRLAEVSVPNESYTFTSENESLETLTNRLSRSKPTPQTRIPFEANINDGRQAPGAAALPVFEELNLRDYQKELALKSIEGHNCLIIAPTGSGKTHVAMYIAKDHLKYSPRRNNRPGKIVFFVPTVALVEQQLRQFEKYMETGCRCVATSGNETQTLELKQLVQVSDVLVMTPQVLLNSLNNKELDSLSVFTLLIFDECHRMTGSSPYNNIMANYYIDQKLADSRVALNLPQVVGMTASPGSGSASSLSQAVEHILTLCANMDATEICTVKENIDELDRWVNRPTEDTKEVRGRTNDQFLQKVSAVMCQIENSIRSRPEIPQLTKEGHNILALMQAPSARGSDPYVQFVSKLKKTFAVIYEQNVRRFFMSCLHHLKVYNNGLLINADCRTKDALLYISKEFQASAAQPGSMAYDQTDRWLDSLYNAIAPELQTLSESPASRNPKLDELERTILSFYIDSSESQGILFCKRREMTAALVSWIKETPTLAHLNPHKLVGATSALKGGMTHNKLEDVLKYFKGGVHKLIVATSVAEEGLDVSKCNYVIRYEHVTNDIARVQARGRARAEDARYVLVAERGRGNIERDVANKQRETMTHSALQHIYSLRPEVIGGKIQELKVTAKTQRELDRQQKAASEAQKRARSHEGDHELRCVKCDGLVSWSSDIRVIGHSHHVTLDDSFLERVEFVTHSAPTSYDDWVKLDKMHCKKCRNDWGIRATYKGVLCCVIKVENLVIVNPRGQRIHARKWKGVPFIVDEFDPVEDMRILSENAVAMI